MKRLVGTALGLAVLVLVTFVPAAFYGVSAGDESPEVTTITNYVADFTLDEQGDLRAVETLTVDFPVSGRHGIFRFFDTADQSAPNARRVPHDISVTMDGGAEPFEVLSEGQGRYRVAKIGSADIEIEPGKHVYRIEYAIDGVIEPGSDGVRSQFFWNLIPGGWRQPIRRSDLTVHLPVPVEQVQCAVGVGATSGCTANGVGGTDLNVTTGRLPPRTPVTIKALLDMATPPAGETRPWTIRYDPVLGPGIIALGVVLLLAGAALAYGSMLGARSREPKPGYPLMYTPPDGIGPAQAKYIFTETIDRETYVATLLHAAERGAVELDGGAATWRITDKAGAAGWAGLDPVTTGVAHLLGGPGSSFVASPTDVEAGKRLQKEIATFERSTRSWAREAGLMTRSGLGSIGGVVVIGAFIVFLVLAVFNPLGMSTVALIPGAFGLGALSLLAAGSGTRRTHTGRELWSRVGGFHRILSTPSAEQRFEFSGRQELYTAYIPWAVALGCADEWAAKYRTEMATEPPVPSYLGGYYAGALTGDAVTSMVDSFSSTVDSAISSYQATQASSSSGGGGFSGGGGGGGGGGGSW